MMQTTTQAALEWRDGLPYSTAFNDVYFSSDNGLLETEYVFIQGNALVERWQSLADNNFTIMETGFGTGLNFLCACKYWLEHAPANAVLHFTSVEKYPLHPSDMVKALHHWPSLKPIADELLTQYETLLNTGTAILFNNRIRLQVLFGDATACLSKLDTKADAWFLDGFAPSKNPEMWQQALFEQMTRLAHSQTTFATFTSAGMVRRGLAAAGFKVNKQPGFGKKREMISGYFIGNKYGG
jgi:tRNA 5-methylaminomethyl-2-thiouridine biosynthesis bifunctional protein